MPDTIRDPGTISLGGTVPEYRDFDHAQFLANLTGELHVGFPEVALTAIVFPVTVWPEVGGGKSLPEER